MKHVPANLVVTARKVCGTNGKSSKRVIRERQIILTTAHSENPTVVVMDNREAGFFFSSCILAFLPSNMLRAELFLLLFASDYVSAYLHVSRRVSKRAVFECSHEFICHRRLPSSEDVSMLMDVNVIVLHAAENKLQRSPFVLPAICTHLTTYT